MRNTLRGKFLIFIVLPVMAALIGLTVVSYFSARRYLLQEIENAGVDALRADSENLRLIPARMRVVLESIAIAEQQGKFNDTQREQIFIHIQNKLEDTVTDISMAFPDGRLVRSTKTALPRGYDPRTSSWYTLAMALPPGRLIGRTSPYPHPATQRPVVTLFKKVPDSDGRILGVLGLDLDVAGMAGALNTSSTIPDRGIRFIVSNDALIFVHPDAALVNRYLYQTGEPMDRQMADHIRDIRTTTYQLISRRGGELWYMGFHRVTGTQSNIVLMMPAEDALWPLHKLVWAMSVILAVFTLIVTGILMLMARRISRPIYALTTAAVKVVEEDRYHDPLAVTSRDELGRLTEAFNQMMAGLRQRDFIRDTFGRYVTREVVKELLDQPDGLRLGGEKRELTIMFCDIRGFTPLSERLDPDQVVGILNRYLATMSALVANHGGTVSEFVGDSLLAIFGAPVRHADSPMRAVTCAVEMQMAMRKINRENESAGLPELGIGIGISTGKVIVGNIGSENRAKYGVVGYGINLAARVEAAAVAGQILIAGTTYEKIKDRVIIRQRQEYHLKGVDGQIVLYDVTGITFDDQLRVPISEDNSVGLNPSLDVGVVRMKDKLESAFIAPGRLTHFSRQWARVVLTDAILPPAEIRMDLSLSRKEDPEFVYARVVKTKVSDDGIEHLLRISYMSPKAGERLP